MEGSVTRLAGVGGRADFCSCKICIHAILGNQSPPSSLHGRIHPAPKLVRLLTMTDGLWNLGAGSCQASYRTLNKAHSSRALFITKS